MPDRRAARPGPGRRGPSGSAARVGGPSSRSGRRGSGGGSGKRHVAKRGGGRAGGKAPQGSPRKRRTASGQPAGRKPAGKSGRKPHRKPAGKSGRKPHRKPAGKSGRKPHRKPAGKSGRKPHRKPAGKSGRKPHRKAPHTGVGPDNLPGWMKEEIRLTTRKDRRAATLRLLAQAVDAYGDEEFAGALRLLAEAKGLSPRASAVRELLGLSAYRLRNWEQALAELRAYRRLTGDTTHMPVEMDALRALERDAAVEKTWERFVELGGNRPTQAEARVVFGSYLLDRGRAAEAWKVAGPARLPEDAAPYELRRWFVAARAALALEDPGTAAQLVRAIRRGDPDMAGLADLSGRIDAAVGS